MLDIDNNSTYTRTGKYSHEKLKQLQVLLMNTLPESTKTINSI